MTVLVRQNVMALIVGVIGSLQALETIKVIASYGEPLVGRLLIFDGLTMSCAR